MKTMKIAMASALALATAAPVYAQGYSQSPPGYDQYPQAQPAPEPGPAPAQGTPYRPTPDYQRAQQQYDAQRAQYEESQRAYRESRADYRAARAAYERRLADWQAARIAYDEKYGEGAYARAYPAPAWDERRWTTVVTTTTTTTPAAGSYGNNTAYAAPIHCDNGATIAGGLIGAAGGAAVGAGVGGGGRGAVLGALVGGGVGAAVGHERDRYKCDERGAYYSYDDTVPYAVAPTYHEDRYVEYQRRGCRLAPAPVSDTDYRYIRVCPDADGRFRITG